MTRNDKAKPFLFIMTSHDRMGDGPEKTGFHFSEMAEPYLILTQNGIEVELASIKGGKPPIDPGSIKDPSPREAAIISEFYGERGARERLEHTLPVADIDMNDYSGIFLPGGHGTMWDFPDNEDLIALIEDAWESGKVIAAVCHGPAALINPRNGDGQPIIKGMSVNCFTDAEEKKVGKDRAVPFLLETRLQEQGARIRKSPPFKSCLTTDGQLITGQNPASASGVAQAILAKLGVTAGHRAA